MAEKFTLNIANVFSGVRPYQTKPIRRVSITGETKTGKTYLMSTFPGLFVIDTDKSLSGMRPGTNCIRLSLNLAEVINGAQKVYRPIERMLLALKESPMVPVESNETNPSGEFKVETIGIDSATMLGEMLQAETMVDPNIGGTANKSGVRMPGTDKASYDEWGALKARLNTIFNLLGELGDLGYYILGTTTKYAQMKKLSPTMEVLDRYMPNILGSTRAIFGHFWDVCAETTAIEKAGKVEYHLRIAPSAEAKDLNTGARNWCGPKELVNATFKELFDEKNFKKAVGV